MTKFFLMQIFTSPYGWWRGVFYQLNMNSQRKAGLQGRYARASPSDKCICNDIFLLLEILLILVSLFKSRWRNSIGLCLMLLEKEGGLAWCSEQYWKTFSAWTNLLSHFSVLYLSQVWTFSQNSLTNIQEINLFYVFIFVFSTKYLFLLCNKCFLYMHGGQSKTLAI